MLAFFEYISKGLHLTQHSDNYKNIFSDFILEILSWKFYLGDFILGSLIFEMRSLRVALYCAYCWVQLWGEV
jgi:hypothetical protein